MLRTPRFDQNEIERVRQGWISTIKQEKARPNSSALRLLPPLLYGEGHPYAIPFSGTGEEASIASLTRDDLLAYHRDFVRPEGATLIIVGDTTLQEITPVLEETRCPWDGQGEAPALPARARVALPRHPRGLRVDQP